MNKALDVARYIVNYSNEKGYPISNIRLQKLLYFVQARFLAMTEEHQPCFDEKIIAWECGPVVKKVYLEFRGWGASHIYPITHYCELEDPLDIWSAKNFPFSNDVISMKNRKRINEVVDLFADYSVKDLMLLIHRQEPWINARERTDKVISEKSLKHYFSEAQKEDDR